MPKRPNRRMRTLSVTVPSDDVEVLRRHYGSWGDTRAAVRNSVTKLAAKLRLMEELSDRPQA